MEPGRGQEARGRAATWVPLAALLAVVCSGIPARALDLKETFDRDWSSPTAPTCRSGYATFVRRVANGPCPADPGPSSWSGAPSRQHGSPACASVEGCRGESVAIERFDELEPTGDAIGIANRGILEIMTSRRRQAQAEGRLQVDLHVHEDVPVSGAGEHYLVLHNLSLTEGDCARDCAGIAHTATSHGDGPDRYRWYGVIAGAFGEPGDPDSPIRVGSVGFAVEVPSAMRKPGDRPNDLIDDSFLPYSVEGRGEAFPAGWYRISIERGSEVYRYSVRRWDGDEFVPIVPDDAASGGTNEREIPVGALAAPLGRWLPPGYVGVSVAWFGGPDRLGAHVDWDDLSVHW